jgi:hypothetical protein
MGDGMSGKRILCLAAGMVVSFVVFFAVAGGIAPTFAASTLGQVVLAAAAALTGFAIGNAAQRRFFPEA